MKANLTPSVRAHTFPRSPFSLWLLCLLLLGVQACARQHVPADEHSPDSPAEQATTDPATEQEARTEARQDLAEVEAVKERMKQVPPSVAVVRPGQVLADQPAPPPGYRTQGIASSAVTGQHTTRALQANGGALYDPGHSREGYAHIQENGFLEAAANPLSTFSIDVDAASYSNVRRFLYDGQVPPPDAVRVEELINYFSYDYPDPDASVPFSVVTEVGAAPWNAAHRLVHVGLQGRRMDAADRPASNLVFLLDVSGSMNSPDKLPLLKQAFGLLTEQLRAEDRVAIVVYAGAAGLVLPSTPGTERAVILESLNTLQAGGSTAGADGIRLAYQVAQENFIDGGNNRVILATDGDFNVGVSSDGELIRLIEAQRTQGTFLTVLGFGTGNLQDAKMEQIANHGNGAYYYLDGPMEAKKVLVRELGSTLFTIAKDVKIQVEFNPARVAAYRLIGYENRMLAAEDFADDQKDAGELGAGHTVTALYEVIPVGVETTAQVRTPGATRYQETRLTDEAYQSQELMTLKLRYKAPDGDTSRLITQPVVDEASTVQSEAFTFSAAVAAFGMVLRRSEHRGQATASMARSLALDALGRDPHGDRAGFVKLIEQYQARITEITGTDGG